MPRDEVSRTANVERTVRHEWVNRLRTNEVRLTRNCSGTPGSVQTPADMCPQLEYDLKYKFVSIFRKCFENKSMGLGKY